MESSELSTSYDQLIEGFDLLIGVSFLKVFEKIFGGTKFENCWK